MEMTLRPYVILDELAIEEFMPIDEVPSAGFPRVLRIVIRNAGQTLALHTRFAAVLGVHAEDLHSEPPNREKPADLPLQPIQSPMAILGPGQARTITVSYDPKTFDEHFWGLIGETTRLHLKGSINYRDLVSVTTKVTMFEYLWTFGQDKFELAQENTML